MLPEIPGMSLGDVAGGLANGGPSSAESGNTAGNITMGGIGNRVENSPWLLIGLIALGGFLLWKFK